MEFTYSLIRLFQNTEAEASASNNIHVTYTKQSVEVLKSNVSLEEAQSALEYIEKGIAYLKGLLEERHLIIKKAGRSNRDEKEHEFEQSILKKDNIYLKEMYISSYSVFGNIEERITQLEGEYLILPGLYKKL